MCKATGVSKDYTGAAKAEAKFPSDMLFREEHRRIIKGRGEEKKQMNHSVLYLTNSLTGIGDMTAESGVLAFFFQVFHSPLIRTLEKLS